MKPDSFDRMMRSVFPGNEVITQLFGGAEPRAKHALPWRDLVTLRFELQKVERELADKLENEKRDPTPDEAGAWDHVSHTIDLLKAEMNFRDMLGERGPRSVTAGRTAPAGSAERRGNPRRRSPGSEEGFVDDDGKRIRVYRSNERISRPAFGPADEPRLGVGDIAFRVLFGRWPTAEADGAARAMNVGTGAEGGFLVPSPLSLSVIDAGPVGKTEIGRL
jgi:HK97 family phage major capsid protein